jgi:MFS family permease
MTDTRTSGDPTALSPAERRLNVLVLGIDMVLFMAAVGLLGQLTLIPLFVSKLTDDPVAIGAVMAAFQLGWLPLLVLAGYFERSARPRRWLLVFSGLERLPALGLTVGALLVPVIAAPSLVGLVYACRFAQSLLGGPAGTSWLEMVSRSVSPRRRGRFMGISTMVGNLLGAGTAALSAPLLDLLGFPLGFAACFGLGFLLLVIGFLPLFWFVEPPGFQPRPPRHLPAQLHDLAEVLATDRRFRRFLLGLSWQAFGQMGAGFLIVYAVGPLGAADDLAGWYTLVLIVGQTIANLFLGQLADHRGFRAVGLCSSFALVGLYGLTFSTSSPLGLLPAFVLLGVSQAGTMMARFAGSVDFAPPDRRPSYIALSNALVSISAGLAPLIGGQTVARFGYGWLFGVSLACSLVAAWMMTGARDRSPAANTRSDGSVDRSGRVNAD